MPAIVDSSGWIEYFIDGPNADCFAAAIENTDDLISHIIQLVIGLIVLFRSLAPQHQIHPAAFQRIAVASCVEIVSCLVLPQKQLQTCLS